VVSNSKNAYPVSVHFAHDSKFIGNNHVPVMKSSKEDRQIFLKFAKSKNKFLVGYTLVLLRSESPISKCAKLYTVAASSNRNQAPRFYYCLFYYIFCYYLFHAIYT